MCASPWPRRLCVVAITWLAVLRIGAAAAQTTSLPPLLEVRVPKPPTVATGAGESFLAYELHVTNFAAQPAILQRVEVATTDTDRRVLLALSDSTLLRALARPGANMPEADRVRLAGGTRAVLFLWVRVDGSRPPTAVRHRLVLQQGDTARMAELETGAIAVSSDAIVIGPPLRGGVWLAANGPANNSGHRRALIPVDGVTAIAQRFAIDYVKLGDDNLTFSGDRLKNESYHAENSEALAVADGLVVAVKDGIPENVPGITSRAVPITLETVGGNHVIIEIAPGRYAFYAHLKPGSLRVRQGQRVQRGTVLGLVGNSGNSTEPHLHFHISDRNSPLGSEGLPYVHDSFELVGHCRMIGMGCVRTAPAVRRGEIPMANALVRFPQ